MPMDHRPRFEGSTMRTRAWAGGVALGLTLILGAPPAHALVSRLTPLNEVISDYPLIFTATVESVDAEKPAVVLTVSEDLKGKAPFRRLPINFTGDSEAQKEKQVPVLLKRLAPRLTLVVFAQENSRFKYPLA